MPNPSQLARLKSQLAAHRRSLNEFAASTQRLHELVSAMIDATPGNANKPSAKRTTSEPRPKRSGTSPASATARRAAGAERPAAGATASTASTASTATKKAAVERRVSRAQRAIALERHWGNLF
jgi:hypothetical protein